MLGGATVRGIEATGVSAFAERCGAGVDCGVDVEAGVDGVVCGGVVAQAERTRNDVNTKRRMAMSISKKKAPAGAGAFGRLRVYGSY